MEHSRYPTRSHYPTTLAMMMTSRQNPLVCRFTWPHYAILTVSSFLASAARYQASMLRSLKEVQADDSVVGFYQATTLGAFFNQTLVDTQAIHQDKLRHGGIVVVHGKRRIMSGVFITFAYKLSVPKDLSQTARGNASFRAFRLTGSFLDAYKKSNFSTTRSIRISFDRLTRAYK